ncbi:hypothetical protein N825_03685 [Skermanella stibiiresistens SB22]|uniref:Uncharacterized protein n=1 Tax=Skermanella stibiiresistens SB22 TaxID=1385369 RepID=W9H644_9PROT|nr:hypothetical protein [Skermanella stibiiresistens]EWY40152.1 hypothetical protein N825_03685 [Skermanella stibiiresistens SB22]
MRQPVTMHFDPAVLLAARSKAASDNRTPTRYIETLMRHDLHMEDAEPTLEVIAPAGIRDSVIVPNPHETAEERKHRDEVFFAVLDAGGY